MPEYRMEGECKPVQLEPFVHQVGGHSSMLRFDDTTVCKPLISRERHFYETMPPELKEFTPQYRGVVEVTFHEDSDGYITLVAYPPQTSSKKSKRMLSPGSSPSSSGEGVQSDSDSENPTATTSKSRQKSKLSSKYRLVRFRLQRSGSIEMVGSHDPMFEEVVDPEGGRHKHEWKMGHNPWSLRCHKEQLAKMKQMKQKNKGKDTASTHKFILLENLASHSRLPCILDLKMGTRQHGDDASDEKRINQMRKCSATTSSTLGVRICGMQVYRANSGRYVCHNKYYGRKLTEEGVHDALTEFIHNGYRLRLELIDQILDRLRKLYSNLSKQSTFRFYSSSLLIMYDGQESVTLGEEPSASSSSEHSPVHDAALKDQTQACGSKRRSETVHRSNSRDKYAENNHNLVDVRMIDFAHATHQGFRDRTIHTGPDQGYLFGLENLIRMFEMLKSRPA